MSLLIELQTIKNRTAEQGIVSVVEAARDLSFHIERTYHVFGVRAGVIRGHHAHKKLRQLLICTSGMIRVILDNGNEIREFILDDPSKGLFVDSGEWRTMEWLRDDSVLMVLASNVYDEEDYIRDYKEFLEWHNIESQREKNENTL